VRASVRQQKRLSQIVAKGAHLALKAGCALFFAPTASRAAKAFFFFRDQ
jgi:hypothetical protein